MLTKQILKGVAALCLLSLAACATPPQNIDDANQQAKSAVKKANSMVSGWLGRVDGASSTLSTQSSGQVFNADLQAKRSTLPVNRAPVPQVDLEGVATPLEEPQVFERQGDGTEQDVGGSQLEALQIQKTPQFGQNAPRCPENYIQISDANLCKASSMCVRLPTGETCISSAN